MASKKNTSQAQKAVSEAKKKTSTSKGGSSTGKKSSDASKTTPKIKTEYDRVFPTSTIIAIVSLCLFVFFLLTAINPDGILLKMVLSVMFGLFGKVGFYFMIPAMLYIFCVFTFGRKTRIYMRGLCMLGFVLICGCIYHLTQSGAALDSGFALIADLYTGGVAGYTGGVICGGIGEFLLWICGSAVSYILLAVGACLTLLGSMQITVLSLAKAIQNRPRDEEEDAEEDYEDIDPAALVVNHIANKRIEHSRQRRQRLEDRQMTHIEEDIDDDLPPELPSPKPVTVVHTIPEKAPARKKPEPQTDNTRANTMMNQIDEIGSPVTAAGEGTGVEAPAQTGKKVANIDISLDDGPIPAKMPELRTEDPIPPAPKTEAEPTPASAAPVKSDKVTAKEAAESAQQVAEEISQNQASPKPMYCFPPIDLLNRPPRGAVDGTAEL